MLIVELETGVWIAPIAGDPGRTLVKDNAQKFETQDAAKLALIEARKFRTFNSAKIEPVAATTKYDPDWDDVPDSLAGSIQLFRD